MIKGLEALERLKNTLLAEGYWQDVLQDVAIIEKELKRLYELDNGPYATVHINRYNELCDKEDAFNALSKDDEKTKKLLSLEIEKNRAFEIIKKKQVSVGTLLVLDDLQLYNDYCDMVGGSKHLTKNEFNLIKECLENE